jgi:hypothetical protein
VVQNWTQIDYDLDPKTRKKIEDVFEIENSRHFRLCKFIAESLDQFFRFAYLACYVLYLCTQLSSLYTYKWLYGHSIAMFILTFILYFVWIVYDKMNDEEWTLGKSMIYYAKLRCIFPKT